MPFIGQEPLTGAYHVLDDITTSATATYNLQLNSAAFSPATANQLLVSLNGVIQKPGSSFTISGSQITFSSALTSSDSIDFIMALGDVLSVGTPTDGTVNTGKLANSAVTDAKIAAMAASKLTGAMPALDGSAMTGVGKVLQVVQTHLNTTQSVASASTSNFADFAGFNATITPSSTSSKIMVMADVNYGIDIGTIHFRLVRGSTAIAVHNNPGGNMISSTKNSRPESDAYIIYSDNLSMNFLDTPNTTSATTYKVQATLGATYNNTMYLNRAPYAGDTNDYNGRGVSTLILMEIGQ